MAGVIIISKLDCEPKRPLLAPALWPIMSLRSAPQEPPRDEIPLLTKGTLPLVESPCKVQIKMILEEKQTLNAHLEQHFRQFNILAPRNFHDTYKQNLRNTHDFKLPG